jgi:AraC-like DNA-binding protein
MESARPREKKAIRRAKEFIQDHFADPISLDALAAHTGISKYHLVRAFSKEVGLPPHAYQNQVRVIRGHTLLGLGHSLAHVALETGFADQSHFGRHFKRVHGLSPAAYLAQARGHRLPPPAPAETPAVNGNKAGEASTE